METEETQDLSQYLDICQRSLQKYMALHEENFQVEHAVLMLECTVICKMGMSNGQYGANICFLCASICIDCLDPWVTTTSEQIREKYQRIYHYLQASQEGEYHDSPISQ